MILLLVTNNTWSDYSLNAVNTVKWQSAEQVSVRDQVLLIARHTMIKQRRPGRVIILMRTMDEYPKHRRNIRGTLSQVTTSPALRKEI